MLTDQNNFFQTFQDPAGTLWNGRSWRMRCKSKVLATRQMSSQSTTLPPPNQITDLAKFRFQGVPLLGNLFQAFVVFQQFL